MSSDAFYLSTIARGFYCERDRNCSSWSSVPPACLLLFVVWLPVRVRANVRFSPGQKTVTPITMRSFHRHEPLME